MDHLSIAATFAARTRETPHAPAVSSTDEQVSYAELDQRANQLAHRLIDLGMQPDQPVAILQARSVELIVSILAVLKAGGHYVPLHEGYPHERMRQIIAELQPAALLTDETWSARAPTWEPTLVVGSEPSLPATRADAPDVTDTSNRLAYVMYTSGSTGEPKGVQITQTGVLSLVSDPCWDGDHHTRVPMVAPHAFDVSTYEIWVPLLRGGCIVVPPESLVDLTALRRLVSEEQVTAMHLTAGLFRVVAEESPSILSGLKEVMTGGDVVSPLAVQRVLAACPDLVVRVLYGPTECTLFSTQSTWRAPFSPRSTMPIGAPMTGVTAYVLDARREPVADHEAGELYVAGPRLAEGYVQRPTQTRERFLPDPWRLGGRMYRTGDLVRHGDDGLLEFVGRTDSQVKIRGFRVEVAEVESVVARHPGVSDAIVVARERNPNDTTLVAYVVPSPEGVTPTDLEAHTRTYLPDYMVPEQVVTLDRMPLSINGKVDRSALAVPGAQPDQSGQPAPKNETERRLCELFEEALDVEEVGVEDNFFELGGQSLSAMRLVNRIKSAFGVALRIDAIFDDGSPAGLADRVGAHHHAARSQTP